jgi:hypothetical protein
LQIDDFVAKNDTKTFAGKFSPVIKQFNDLLPNKNPIVIRQA